MSKKAKTGAVHATSSRDGVLPVPPVADGARMAADDRRATGRERLAVVIARRIESDLRAQGWPPGHVIGSQDDLIRRYECSRAVLREAVRLLEHQQVATMRRGPGGGLVVNSSSGTVVSEVITAYLEFTDVSALELLEARLPLELLAARLAAERLDEAGIEHLRQFLEYERGPDSHRYELHVLLGELSRNPILAAMVRALNQVGMERLHKSTSIPDEVEAEAAVSHEAVLLALMAADGASAQYHLRSHLEHARDFMLRATAPGRGAAHIDDLAWFPAVKAPERLARQIKVDIRANGLRDGDVLGTEAEIQHRYGVGRSTYREAVRILETYGIAESRFGGRGLTVREPNPSETVAVVARHLRSLRPSRRDIRELAVGVMRTCVPLAIHRDPSRVEQLRDVEVRGGLASERCWDFQSAIAEMSGNRALHLVTLVLGHMDDESSTADHVDSHRSVLEAMADGDAELASHRVAHHLRES